MKEYIVSKNVSKKVSHIENKWNEE